MGAGGKIHNSEGRERPAATTRPVTLHGHASLKYGIRLSGVHVAESAPSGFTYNMYNPR